MTRNTVSCARCRVFDLATALGTDPALYYDDMHFNEAGARALSEILTRELRAHELAK